MFQLEFKTEKFQPRARALMNSVSDVRPLLAAAGRGVAGLLRRHFEELEQDNPNWHGWPRQHFWRAVRDSVQPPVVSGSGTRGTVSVTIAHQAIAQKIFGGPIEPRRAKFLTLPASAAAYGRRAGDFSGLKFARVPDPDTQALRAALVFERGGGAFVARGPRAEKIRRAAHKLNLVVLFWLVRHVYQEPQPGALPTEAELHAAASRAAADWADALNAKLSH